AETGVLTALDRNAKLEQQTQTELHERAALSCCTASLGDSRQSVARRSHSRSLFSAARRQRALAWSPRGPRSRQPDRSSRTSETECAGRSSRRPYPWPSIVSISAACLSTGPIAAR